MSINKILNQESAVDIDTKLLLHFDGTDGQTTTIDSTGNHIITLKNTAQLDTDYKKFGSSSLLLDGNSDYVTVPDSDDWNIVNSNIDDWTIDFFIKFVSPTAQEYLVCQSEDGNNGWFLGHTVGSGLTFRVWRLGSSIVNTGVGGEITDSNWHHIALCKVADEYATYLDGTQGNYDKASAGNAFSALLTIGCWGVGNALFNGHIDELRIQHANILSASPNVGKTDTITVPTSSYNLSKISRFINISISDILKIMNVTK